MKVLFDLLPVIVFFGAFRLARSLPEATVALVVSTVGALSGTTEQQVELSAVIVASVSAIVVTALQISWLLARRLPVKPAVWISAVLIVVFGGLTVWLRNEWFIKWKPSILYWAFAAILAGGKWIWGRNLLGALLSGELELPQLVWDRLLVAWTIFFVVLGAANLYVAYTWSTDSWVNFKTFGLLGSTLGFSILSGFYLARYIKSEVKTEGDG